MHARSVLELAGTDQNTREVLGDVHSLHFSSVLISPQELSITARSTADKFCISFIKYNYDFKASFQSCSLHKCLNICTRVLCALIMWHTHHLANQSVRYIIVIL